LPLFIGQESPLQQQLGMAQHESFAGEPSAAFCAKAADENANARLNIAMANSFFMSFMFVLLNRNRIARLLENECLI
jgi:hypothetical protein